MCARGGVCEDDGATRTHCLLFAAADAAVLLLLLIQKHKVQVS
jgi:hypothetical protein